MYVWHVDYTYKNIWVCANERQTTNNNTNHPGACIIIDSPQPQNHTNDSAGEHFESPIQS